MDARKVRFDREAALRLARAAARVVSIRGPRVAILDMKREPPDDETLAKAVLGPRGTLRAPVMRMGTTLFVGFNERAFTANVE